MTSLRLLCDAAPTFAAFLLPGLALVAAPSGTAAADAPPSEIVFELRVYTAHPGKLADLHKRFREHTVKLFEKHGIVNVLYGVPVGSEDTLVYFLAHKSEEEAAKSWQAFRDDPAWQAAYKASHANGPLVAKATSTFLAPTDYSAIRTAAAAGAKSSPGAPARLFELRTYTTLPGRLPALNARFRDHTTKLFEKHGMVNHLYGVPTAEGRKDDTLVYVVIHKDQGASEASWKGFVADPDWQKVRAASEADGKILAPNGVQRQFLVPTDYSPLK